MRDRTDSHIPRRAIPLACSFRTSAPVGIHKHLDPTNPGSCREGNSVSVLLGWWRLRGNDVQVISSRRRDDDGPFRDKQFGVHPPGGTDNRFREGYDVIFYRCSRRFGSDGVDPQGFLYAGLMNFTIYQRYKRTVPANLRKCHQIWHTLKIVDRKISVTSCLDFRQRLVNLCAHFILKFSVFG